MVWGRARRGAGEAGGVVAEAERLLGGRTVDGYIARRQRVPAWSLVGLLAHGTRADLGRLASPAAAPDRGGWSGTVAGLAGDLLRRSRDERSLVALQRRSLIPLELDLLAGALAPPTTPAELRQMVAGTLEASF
jgi:hypothetical protein